MRAMIVGIFLLSMIACQNEASVSTAPVQQSFFDLKGYFTQEIEKLSAVGPFKKTTWINEASETKTFDTLDFERELALFVNADINRPAWVDQYQVDSVLTETGQLSELSYQALRPELKTQVVVISFLQGQPTYFKIDQLMENALMNASMELEYYPGKKYRIVSRQDLKLSEKRNMTVQVEW